MRIHSLLICFLTLTITACSKTVPVMVGGEEDYDACGSAAETTENVNVYSAPDSKSKTKDVIAEKIYVAVCDFPETNPENKWAGIVYNADGVLNCGVGSPIEKRQAYDGTCKSGWVKKDKLQNWAG